MSKSRLEAFTDAVIAIIMTVLVLELGPLTDLSWHGLWHIRTEFLSYIFSFFILAVTWNNHHHMLQAAKKIDGSVLWANMNLLFWLSLFPFVTATVDKNWYSHFAETLYVILYLLYNVAWNILRMTLTHANPKLGRFLGYKDVYTFFGVLVVMLLTFFWAPAGIIGCFVATLFWIIPYRDIERLFAKSDN
ncbi:TMEM175 family protein [Pediococcus inopinatus]|nr:TMEM175 family protein [Pediococcus inopinatus]WPC17245.1 TMEM175 family protein [Pediococcus inopinatus]